MTFKTDGANDKEKRNGCVICSGQLQKSSAMIFSLNRLR
jgi:hypothetical protein